IHALPGGEHLRTFELTPHAAGRLQDLARRHLDAEVGRIEAEPAQRRDQLRLRHDAGATAGELAVHPLVDVYFPAGATQQQRCQGAAQGAADHDRPARMPALQATCSSSRPVLIRRKSVIYCADICWRNPMALTMMDKATMRSDKSPWSPELDAEFA